MITIKWIVHGTAQPPVRDLCLSVSGDDRRKDNMKDRIRLLLGIGLFALLPLHGTAQEFLPPDQAFVLKLKAADADTVVGDFAPAPGYYLYRDKIRFAIQSPPGVSVKGVALPPGDIKEDPAFGRVEVYHKPVQAILRLNRQQAGSIPLTVSATYQGCSEKGLCYPPIHKTFALTLTGSSGQAVQPSAPATLQPLTAPNQATSSQIEDLLKGGSFWLNVAFFFGAGLLLSLTPCMFPMIPILSGIIVGQRQPLTKLRALALSSSYVLGMALTYAIAGVAAGLSGTLLSNALQNPWVLTGFALVFVMLALSMFGFYELQMPAFIQSRLVDTSNKMKGGSAIGVGIMGVLSALIVGPCVAAPLAGALLYISNTHDVWLGGSALFAMALGMGVPLLLVGVSAGTLLPKAGQWMNAVKSFFGVLLLGVALWLISPVIPTVVQMALWAVLLIVCAIYLRALDPLPAGAGGFAKLWKGVGVIALIAGVSLLVGALSGSHQILQPLAGLRTNPTRSQAAQGGPPFERVLSVSDLEKRVTQSDGRYVMLDFYADWCVSCKEMERFTFGDGSVQQRLGPMVLLRADVTANNLEDRALLKKFSLFGPPAIIFFDTNGKELQSARVVGYLSPKAFLDVLETKVYKGREGVAGGRSASGGMASDSNSS